MDRRFLVAAASLYMAGCSSVQATAQGVNPNSVTDQMLVAPPSEDWLMFRGSLNSWGHSPLADIRPENVKQLRLVWKRVLPQGIQEGTPLVHKGVMYFPGPRDLTIALNATTGSTLWEYQRPYPPEVAELIPFPDINRSLAIYGDTIIDHGNDQFMYALNIADGKLAWEQRINDFGSPSQNSTGPITAAGKIFSTRGCEATGSADGCIVTAHDARTGKELWRTRLIPGPGEPGDESWGGVPMEQRRHVGAWYSPSYDPELNTLIFGTSVTSPAPKYLLGGNEYKYLYHNSTLSLDADTGRIIWHYQHLVDHWDLDHPFERLLIDTEVAPDPAAVPWINPRIKPGETRKVITGIPGKTGLVYTLDRQTGEFLWARPTVFQNVVSEIVGSSGEVKNNPEAVMEKQGDTRTVCPGIPGGKNWQAGAFNPATRLMYFPLQHSCMTVTAVIDRPSSESLYGVSSRLVPVPNHQGVGSIYAIDVATGRTAWTFDQEAGTMSLLSTGGGLIFGGDAAGRFRAFDAASGAVLWETELSRAVTGFPVSFAVDGKQYIAVSTGPWLHAALNPGIKVGDENALYVFAVDPTASAAVSSASAEFVTPVAGSTGDPAPAVAQSPRVEGDLATESRSIWDGAFATAAAERGAQIYAGQCSLCHGANFLGTAGAPALRGPAFLFNWRAKRVSELHSYIHDNMPPGRAGTLPDQAYSDVTSAILRANGFPAGADVQDDVAQSSFWQTMLIQGERAQ